ncbi:RnfH family protein [Nitrosovibrio sp. Nv17]|uniref:RnfH family protein n=1 Tax=Nitrosovibrio sp. Nv17 TaxID=1855339 RepID=UPI002101CDD3|nr:RnfH family protein [Nitrosovibrio sp. Nv17]
MPNPSTTAPEATLEVEVVYALPHGAHVRRLRLPAGATAWQAVERCGILDLCPEIDLACNRIGVFGKLVDPDTILRDRDRVEIYRPLRIDPKEARRKRSERAAKKRRIADTG